MKYLYFALNVIFSLLAVLLQEQVPLLSQWICIYFTVFVIAWFGGMIHGMVSTVVTILFAGWYLIPPTGTFNTHDAFELVILMMLGFWISYSMEEYKYSKARVTGSEELARSLGFLDTLLENLPLMVFVKDAKELRFVRFNRAGLELLGFKMEDLIGKNDYDMFPLEEANHFTRKDKLVLEGKGIIDIPREIISTKFRGQRILHTKKIPILDKNGVPLYLLGVSEDITEKIEAEEFKNKNLAQNAARMERLRIQEKEILVANAISTLSTTLDYEETLLRIATIVVPSLGDWSTLTVKNDLGQYERVASIHSDPALQPLVDEFMKNYPPGEKDMEIKKALEKGESTLMTHLDSSYLKLRSQDQRKFELYQALGTYSSMIIPVRARDQVLGALSIARGDKRPVFDELDLTLAEEIGRRAGTVLENSQLFKSTQKAVRARDEFLSIASHELKTPITSLKLQLQILQRSNADDTLQRPLKNAIGQVDRLTSLVNDLLDVSKFESGKLTYHFVRIKIGHLVLEIVENFKNQFHFAGIELVVDVNSDVEVEGDRYRLEQVFVNLFNNALKYGGKNPVHIKLSHDSSRVTISIRDHGKGIPQIMQQKIFEKFERGTQDSNISGLGLGLFISKEIVNAHKGFIELESVENEWSEFRVVLPIA